MALEQLVTTDKALAPPWTPLAHALAHSRGDGHQAQPEGLETIPSRSAQCWHLPREARSRLERSVEASIGHVSRAAGCHMPGSALAATLWDQTSGGGSKYGKVARRCMLSAAVSKNRSCQPRFCRVGTERPNLSTLTSHPCIVHGRSVGGSKRSLLHSASWPSLGVPRLSACPSPRPTARMRSSHACSPSSGSSGSLSSIGLAARPSSVLLIVPASADTSAHEPRASSASSCPALQRAQPTVGSS